MTNYLLDYTFLEALINVNHENHKQAEKLAENIRDHDLSYVPNHILILLMDKNKQYIGECQKIFEILNNSTRIDCSMDKNKYIESFNNYKTSNNLNFNDWLTLTYMKQKDIKFILSFNEKFDKITGIKRIYKENYFKNNSFRN